MKRYILIIRFKDYKVSDITEKYKRLTDAINDLNTLVDDTVREYFIFDQVRQCNVKL